VLIGFGVASIASGGTGGGGRDPRCGDSRVDVAYATPAEAGEICVALADVVRYFRAVGFRIVPRISVIVQTRPAAGASRDARMHGFLDTPGQKIVVFRAPDLAPWGVERDRDLASSFIRHEFVHMAILQVLPTDYVRLRPEWHEFIAYVAQLALMDDALRDRVLARYPDVEAATELTAINELTYAMDPDRFAITAYRTYLARGRDRFGRSAAEVSDRPTADVVSAPTLIASHATFANDRHCRGA